MPVYLFRLRVAQASKTSIVTTPRTTVQRGENRPSEPMNPMRRVNLLLSFFISDWSGFQIRFERLFNKTGGCNMFSKARQRPWDTSDAQFRSHTEGHCRTLQEDTLFVEFGVFLLGVFMPST